MRPELLHILQHSLGLDKYGKHRIWVDGQERYGFHPNRNHFCAGGDDELLCRELVKMGLMSPWPNADQETGHVAGFPYYNCSVTEAGKKAVRDHSPAPPKLTRSQQRYRRFLGMDCGLSFREFLQMEKEAAR